MNGDRSERRRFSVLLLDIAPKYELLATIGIMAVLIAVVYLFNIPNPNMILIAGLVVSSAVFGYTGGVTAGVIMFLYTLFFFSTGNDFKTFTPQNLQKVMVSLIGIVADMVFVCELKRYEMQAFREIRKLTEELSEDNTKLQEVSCIDALTGIRNRYALRNDYPGYFHKDVHVIMLDIDNFKLVNDTCGHDMGDRFLQETGHLLAGQFGRDCCYRYGGDEFLVVIPNMEEAEFQRKLNHLLQHKPVVEKDGRTFAISYSIGYTHGRVRAHEELRNMFAEADEKMYAAKHAGKNMAKGNA